MRFAIAALLVLCLASPLMAEKTVELEDWARMTVPEQYKTGEAFQITVELLKVDGPTKLIVNANWKKTGGQFGGFLQMLGISKDVSEPGTHTFNVTIRNTKPDLGSAVLTAYLSSDGHWKNRTKMGVAEVPLAKAGGGASMDDLAAKSEKTQKARPFKMAAAPKLPSLEAGGFAAEPALHDDFDPGWPKKADYWLVATWKQNRTQMSPERCRVDDKGHLVQTVLGGKLPGEGGSMQSKIEFGYGRWVARVKPTSVPGILNSIFTKDWDDLTTPESNSDGDKGEVDIELLSHTYGPDSGEVHLAIHLEGHTPLWHLDIPLDFNPSDDFHEWGFDILPDRVVWHVDGRVIHEWKYTERFRINPNYEFFFNSWTMKNWIKGPPAKDGDYLIDWVKFYPYKGEGEGAAAPRPAGRQQSAAPAGKLRPEQNALSQFAGWPQGEDFFPIGVWAQDPRDAGRYQALGVNFYYGLHGGPTPEQVAGLRRHGMPAVCHYNAYASEHLRHEPLIWGWMHRDEPDLAHCYPRDMLKAPGGKQIIKEHWPEIYRELDLDNNEYNGWGLGLHPINDLQADYKHIKSESPEKPVFLQLSQAVAYNGVQMGRGDRSGKTWEYPLYIEGADVVSYDIYPVAYGKADQLWLVPRGLDQLKAWGSGDRPLMMVLEAGFGEQWASKHQMRAQVWMSVNHGAAGIVWFVHRWSEQGGKKKLVSTKMPLDNEEVGQMVKDLNDELKRLAPVINSPALDGVASARGAELDLGARKADDTTYVFAVERAGENDEATIRVRGIREGTAEVLGEDRTIPVRGGRFRDRFDAWDTHLYRIR